MGRSAPRADGEIWDVQITAGQTTIRREGSLETPARFNMLVHKTLVTALIRELRRQGDVVNITWGTDTRFPV